MNKYYFKYETNYYVRYETNITLNTKLISRYYIKY